MAVARREPITPELVLVCPELRAELVREFLRRGPESLPLHAPSPLRPGAKPERRLEELPLILEPTSERPSAKHPTTALHPFLRLDLADREAATTEPATAPPYPLPMAALAYTAQRLVEVLFMSALVVLVVIVSLIIATLFIQG